MGSGKIGSVEEPSCIDIYIYKQFWNIIQTDFLDIELNLTNKIYIPFSKPNLYILYVSNQSYHPNQILKQLPITINEKL